MGFFFLNIYLVARRFYSSIIFI